MNAVKQASVQLCCVLLLMLQECTHSQRTRCERVNICIINGTYQDSCRSPVNISDNISILSNDTLLLCKNVSIEFTGGTHYLTNNVNFPKKVKSITVLGASGKQSTIVCIYNSGISFGEENSVFIENVILQNCSRNQSVTPKNPISVALLFKTANYTLTNVIVTHTQGFSLYAYKCYEQVITDCKFDHNSRPAMIKITNNAMSQAMIIITRTQFSNGIGSKNNSGGLQVDVTQKGAKNTTMIITDCKFDSNSGQNGSHLLIKSKQDHTTMSIKIMNSTFSAAKGDNINSYGATIIATQNKNLVETYIQNCTFAGNDNGALYISGVYIVSIHRCSVLNNNGTGIVISKQSFRKETVTNILNSNFKNNARALLLNLTVSNKESAQKTNIKHCVFTDHNVSSMTKPSEVVLIQGGSDNNNMPCIEFCTFQSNHGTHGNCSALNIESMNNVSLNNVTITDNVCTGIMLTASDIYIRNYLNVMRNFGMLGGGIQMNSKQVVHKRFQNKHSTITMMPHSKLSIINNTASLYGGGILTDTHCDNKTECFYKFDDTSSPVIHLMGNIANLGGDAIYGACLSHHFIEYSNNILSLQDNKSQSVVADQVKTVVFCKNSSSQHKIQKIHDFSSSRELTAFRGEVLTIPLMAVDDCCTPSGGTVMAFQRQNYEAEVYLSRKYCKSYNYLVTAGANESNLTITIELLPEVRSQVISNKAVMTVVLTNCPIGFTIRTSGDKCTCIQKLKNYTITCNETDYSLLVPPSTWIGYHHNGVGIMITTRCEHCSMIAHKVTSKSQDLHCSGNRTGILCGSCINNLSLQLGDNLCSDCSNSAYKGVLLLITFAVMGIILIVVLLSLNLTVSAGLINAMIFYSNIVHTNREIFLPVDADHAQPHLQNVIRFLRIFQAWMNLDFGINTCFFPDFNTYISTWMQFLFPVFIWLLILALVVVSKYSSKVSRLTGSKTVPALATLLLLSYTKLLIAIIFAGSYTTLIFLEHEETHKVWILDGNVAYLKGKHVPLFLMSLFMGTLYIIPFTLIVVLGPLIQTKSDHMLLSWINRVKPLLDAFYGPYDGRYRYWPGLLLLARLILLCTFAYYSEGDGPFKLGMIMVVVVMVYTVWNLLGRGHMHGKKHLNYLEVFFDVNLITFASVSMYLNFTKITVKNQQILAIVMVGSVFLVFCGIVIYQVFKVILRLKVAQELLAVVAVTRVWSKIKGRAENVEEVQERQSSVEDSKTQATHSVLKMTPLQSPCELREPLLCD